MEWQPIETAPKDGAWIMVPYPLYNCAADRAMLTGYRIMIVHWNGVGWDSDGAWMLHEDPAHWMPLPPPP